jgi:hypothetical protein
MPAAETPQITKTSFSRRVRRVLGLDLHSWEQWMLLSLGVAALAAIAVVVTSASVVILTRHENAETKKEYEAYKLTVDGKVADAKREGIEAGKTAGNALVRAAELEKEAANARLETERLKAVVAWRAISAPQVDELVRTWSLNPGSVNVYWQDGDPEALFFAIQLSNVLQRANWKVSALAMSPNNGILFNLIVPPVSGMDADSLRSGLVAAKIPFSAVHPAAMQSFSTTGSMQNIPNAPLLVVGSRMPVAP